MASYSQKRNKKMKSGLLTTALPPSKLKATKAAAAAGEATSFTAGETLKSMERALLQISSYLLSMMPNGSRWD